MTAMETPSLCVAIIAFAITFTGGSFTRGEPIEAIALPHSSTVIVLGDAQHWSFESPPDAVQTWWKLNRVWAGPCLMVIVFLIVIFPRASAVILCGALGVLTLETRNLYYAMLAAIVGGSSLIIREVRQMFLSDPRQPRTDISAEAVLEPTAQTLEARSVSVADRGSLIDHARPLEIGPTSITKEAETRRSHYGDHVAVQQWHPPSTGAGVDIQAALKGWSIFVDYDFKSEVCRHGAQDVRDALSAHQVFLKGSETGADFCIWIHALSDPQIVGFEVSDSRNPSRTKYRESSPPGLADAVHDVIATMIHEQPDR